ncbi:caspase family protein [Pseudanabaenaceae cyanobacterium LEGE 13415]|nr:caspase family protein [Pseudanabaenaceae cyanobacterium LEGE 13415]
MSEFLNSFAIVIGINQYQNGIAPLHNAVNDAKALITLLHEKHKYQVLEYLDEAATLKNLELLLETTLLEKVTKHDRVIFYFAGHGIALNNDDDPEGYLIPQDAIQGKVQTYLPMIRLQKALEKLPCRHFLGILDCCFAGAFRWGSTRDLLAVPEVIYQERYDRFIRDPAWQIITSAASDQKALDSFSLSPERGADKHSPFAAALIEALAGDADCYPAATSEKRAGDGVVTATELYSYLYYRIQSATKQTPGFWPLKKHDKGEYIFLTPGHPLYLPLAEQLDEKKNPYRGLESFESDHKDLFFGRTDLIEQLEKRVATQPLTIVIGASGCGKSSLVKAGLIPELEETDWMKIVIRPGRSPYTALNIALKQEATAQKSYVELISNWKQGNPSKKIVLVIDQSEELITLCQNEQESHRFLEELEQVITKHSDTIKVILTLRSDFEPQLRDLALKKRWQSSRFIVPAMSRSQLRDAIEKPAEVRVMYFEPHDLVEKLIDEVAAMPGALPLLSFALSELYLNYIKRLREGKAPDRAITQEDYDKIGGVTRSLTQRADQECTHLGKDYEQTIKLVMLRMIAVGSGGLARRRVFEKELTYPPARAEQVEKVKKTFTEARLLVEGRDDEGNSYVEPAHDALIQGWAQLRDWVKAEKNLALQRRLTPAAIEWEKKQQKRCLWNADPYLEVLQKEVLNSPKHNWLNQVETEFVQRSVQQKKRNIGTRWGLAIALMLASVGFAGFQWNQNQLAQSRNLASSSQTLKRSGLQIDTLIDAIAAGKTLKRAIHTDDETNITVVSTLQQAIYELKEADRLQKHTTFVTTLNLSSDGKWLASADNGGTINLWSQDGKFIRSFGSEPGKAYEINSISFSPDSKIIAVGSDDNLIRLWSLNGQLIQTFKGHQDEVINMSFSPDGKMIASGCADGSIKLWSLNGKEIRTLSGKHDDAVHSLMFSRDGKKIISASRFTTKVWSVNGKELRSIQEKKLNMRVILSPDGKTLATLDFDYNIKLWSLDNQKTVTLPNRARTSQFNGYDTRDIYAFSFSPDGQHLAVANSDFTITVWNLATQQWTILERHYDVIKGLGFSADGKTLVSGSQDTTIKFWSLADNLVRLKGSHASLSRSGQLAIAGDTGAIQLWNRDITQVSSIRTGYTKVNEVSFSPDGETLAVTGDDGTVKLWNANTLQPKPFNLQIQEKVNQAQFSSDSNILIGTNFLGSTIIFGLDGKEIANFNRFVGAAQGVSLSPDGKLLAEPYPRGFIIRNVADQKELSPFTEEELRTTDRHDSLVTQVRFSPDGQTLASASEDRTIKLWNLQGEELVSFKGHNAEVTSISFSPNSKILASASADNTIKLWNFAGREIASFTEHTASVTSINFSRDSKRMVSTDSEGTTIVWNLDLDDLLKRGCDRIRNYLKTNPNVRPIDRTLCDD